MVSTCTPGLDPPGMPHPHHVLREITTGRPPAGRRGITNNAEVCPAIRKRPSSGARPLGVPCGAVLYVKTACARRSTRPVGAQALSCQIPAPGCPPGSYRVGHDSISTAIPSHEYNYKPFALAFGDATPIHGDRED